MGAGQSVIPLPHPSARPTRAAGHPWGPAARMWERVRMSRNNWWGLVASIAIVAVALGLLALVE